MANTIEPTNYNSRNFVTATSRYASSEIIYYGDNRLITFKIYKLGSYQTNPNDLYSIVPPGWEYRPDKASMEVYNTPDFWWRILEANGIKDVYDFKAGINIRIPFNPY